MYTTAKSHGGVHHRATRCGTFKIAMIIIMLGVASLYIMLYIRLYIRPLKLDNSRRAAHILERNLHINLRATEPATNARRDHQHVTRLVQQSVFVALCCIMVESKFRAGFDDGRHENAVKVGVNERARDHRRS